MQVAVWGIDEVCDDQEIVNDQNQVLINPGADFQYYAWGTDGRLYDPTCAPPTLTMLPAVRNAFRNRASSIALYDDGLDPGREAVAFATVSHDPQVGLLGSASGSGSGA